MYDLEKFEKSLVEEGIAEGTIHTYICHIKEYFDWLLGSGEVEFKRLYRQNILEWHNEKEDVWYSYLPDDSKSNKRKKIKRKRKRDLEDVICDFYSSMQSEHEDMEKKDYSIKSMFYEFMKHKSNEVGSGTIKRMMADWARFYEPEKEFIAISVQNLTKINVDDFFNTILA